MDISFSIEGMIFEYDEYKNAANIKNMVYLLKLLQEYFWIMTE